MTTVRVLVADERSATWTRSLTAGRLKFLPRYRNTPAPRESKCSRRYSRKLH
jgi:hypothetical protein